MDRQELIYILRAAASRQTDGDFSSRRDISGERAREELSAMSVWALNNTFLIDDEVSEVLARHLNKKLACELAFFTLRGVKEKLLAKDGAAWIGHYRGGLSSEAVSALAKIMTDRELGVVCRKIFNILPGRGRIEIGSTKHFGSQIEVNSANDDWNQILLLLLDGLCYGCGDVMFHIIPSYGDVETVVRFANLLADIILRFRLPTRWCVHSDMATLSRARERGANVALGFQCLYGTSRSLKDGTGLGVREILSLSRDFPGLYFEIAAGFETANGDDADVDTRTLSSRAAGLARDVQQTTGKWTVTKMVANPIGLEQFRTTEGEGQLFRTALEDVFIQKMHGLTGGIDVRAPFSLGIHPRHFRELAQKIIFAAQPAFAGMVPGGIETAYETVSFRDYPTICVQREGECHLASAMQKRLIELDLMEERGLVKADPCTVLRLYMAYQSAFKRSRYDICKEAEFRISKLQAKGFDVGYGCSRPFLTPSRVEKRLDDIYRNALAKQSEPIEIQKNLLPKQANAHKAISQIHLNTDRHSKDIFCAIPA